MPEIKTLGITYEELVEIYAVCGHTIKQPASVKAIAVALNTVAAKILENVNDRFNSYYKALQDLNAKVVALQGAPKTAKAWSGQTGHMCYCGAIVTGERCEVCGRSQ